MTTDKVNCELVSHFEEKLLLHVVFSLGFHVESNLKIFEMELTMSPDHMFMKFCEVAV